MTDSSSAIIQQIDASLDQGKLADAIKLSRDFWGQGGEMNDSDVINYTNSLLNMGEVERAGILLQPALDNPRNHTDFAEVMIKYAILVPNLVRLKQLGEYTNIYQQNPEIFDWVTKAFEQRNILEYSILLKTAQNNLPNKILRFEYEVNNEVLEADFYTIDNEKDNDLTTKKITREINKQFTRRGLEIPDKMNLNIFCVENFKS